LTKNTKGVLIHITKEDHQFLQDRGMTLSTLGRRLFNKYVEETKMKDILYDEHMKKREEMLNAVQQPQTNEDITHPLD